LRTPRLLLVIAAGVCYFVSFVLRARGWRRLFPRDACPDQARCLASVGAVAASGVVLPFRLDYLVKIGTLRQGPRAPVPWRPNHATGVYMPAIKRKMSAWSAPRIQSRRWGLQVTQ
jgi:hypothetical protein